MQLRGSAGNMKSGRGELLTAALLHDTDDFQKFLLQLRRAFPGFQQDLFFQRAGWIRIIAGKDIIDGHIQCITDGHQQGQRNFGTAVFNVADMAGIDAC